MIATQKSRSVPETDARLIQRILSGDDTAFYRFYKRHARYISGVAFRLLADDGDVDDVVQETFVTASLKLKSLKAPEHVRLWLVKIAVRHAQKRLRLRTRTRAFADMANVGPMENSDMYLASMLDDLRDVLRRLSSKVGEPWILHRLEGLTFEEVSLACDVSVATVKRRVAAADRKVKRRIDIHV